MGKDCPKTPCKVEIRINCKCGRRHTFAECGAYKKVLRKVLKCDDACNNFKRFGAIYKRVNHISSLYSLFRIQVRRPITQLS